MLAPIFGKKVFAFSFFFFLKAIGDMVKEISQMSLILILSYKLKRWQILMFYIV